jgi:hypothetical protein
VRKPNSMANQHKLYWGKPGPAVLPKTEKHDDADQPQRRNATDESYLGESINDSTGFFLSTERPGAFRLSLGKGVEFSIAHYLMLSS